MRGRWDTTHNEADMRKNIRDHILRCSSAEDIFKLFHVLNYPKEIINSPTSRRKKEAFDFKKEDVPRIGEIFPILSFKDKFPVFLIEVKSLHTSFIRSVSTTINNQYLPPFLLIFTVNYSDIVFVFPSSEREGAKQKLKLTKLVITKDDLHYTDIVTIASLTYTDGATWRDVWKQWKKAFSVERVTEEFFEDYKKIFFSLRDEVVSQKNTSKEAHEFALQFLNRIMFLYFISKKDWLGNKKFVAWLWTSYKKENKFGFDEFYSHWLQQVFLKVFNNRVNEVTGLPDEIKNELLQSPYLNGGLFSSTPSDSLPVSIPDSLFEKVFNFFEGYNFTIREDMPLDEEVSVDPQMIGYVYESLANVAQEIYDRNDLGIFYTPRIEVDFMCRRALVEYLTNNLVDLPKEEIYHIVFDPPESREKVEAYFTEHHFWNRLEEVLDRISVVDPACGSGAFLVGMLNVLTDLYQPIQKQKKSVQKSFTTKFQIIQRSLYGVDVMPWAIHAAELRLWLQLIVETDLKRDDLRKHPLLPNLNLNLRIGDSLVQKIGGITLHVRTSSLDNYLKRRLDSLKQEKQKYYENSPSAKFSTIEEVNNEELVLFEEIIDQAAASQKRKITKAESIMRSEKLSTKQAGLFGAAKTATQTDLRDKKRKEECLSLIESCNNEIEHLAKVKRLLANKEKRPFVWDIDFAEVFGDKNGFDIVIGNPPYVRQEMISPPNRMKAEVSSDDRKAYKDDLIESVMAQFPVIGSLDSRSDLYIYFYFHGLSLLNEKGTFCFITSNSWLDVGYGKELQDFLLRFVPIHAIYDNPKRSFEHADVNTIISLFGAPSIRDETRDDSPRLRQNAQAKMFAHTSKFVMFRKSFEEVLTARNLIAIDAVTAGSRGESITDLVKNVVQTLDYRVFPVVQEDLLEDGWEYPEGYDVARGMFKAGKYVGNKWGGKYLRAPDIFYTILEKGKDKLVKIGDIADVWFGIKTGANEFFYLDDEAQKRWKIEPEFLKPAIKSPKEVERLIIDPKNLKYKLIVCNKTKSQLKNTNILKYIEWGEHQIIEVKKGRDKGVKFVGYQNLESIKNRKLWYNLDAREPALLNFNYLINDYGVTFYGEVFVSDNFHKIHTNKNIHFFMNSTIFFLFQNMLGRASFGGGLLKIQTYELEKMLVIPTTKQNILKIFHRTNKNIYEECGFDPTRPIREQEPKPLPDRAELDTIFFDVLGLTPEERKEVYWSVCELVRQRLEKARSLKGES
jgi:hypothetical protein